MENILKLVQWLEWVVLALTRLLVYVGAAFLSAITALLVLSSIQRYVVGSPIGATEDLVAALFVVMAFLPVAYTFLIDRHIRLELLWSRLPPLWRDLATVVGQIFSLVVLVFCIKPTWDFAMFSIRIGAMAETANMPVGPWMLVIPVSLSLLAASVLIRMLHNVILLVLGGGQPTEGAAARRGKAGW